MTMRGRLQTWLRAWLGIDQDSRDTASLVVGLRSDHEALVDAYGALVAQHSDVVRLLADARERLAYYEEHVESIKSAKARGERRLIIGSRN